MLPDLSRCPRRPPGHRDETKGIVRRRKMKGHSNGRAANLAGPNLPRVGGSGSARKIPLFRQHGQRILPILERQLDRPTLTVRFENGRDHLYRTAGFVHAAFWFAAFLDCRD